MLKRAAQFTATLAAVAALAFLALQPIMALLQQWTAQAAAAMLGAHHQHEPAVALRDDLVLQVLGPGAAGVLLQRAAQLLPHPHLS